MTPPSFRLVFMGTPDFAVPSLVALDKSRHSVLRVITQPDRPRGRGRRMMATPVKQTALRLGYDVFQPPSARDEAFFKCCFEPDPDLIVVVAYGRILPATVVFHPPHGVINVHASLLPRYRGAAPIQWAIINGDKHTGVTTMRLDAGMDTGDILLTAPTAIRPDETAATLHDRLAGMGAQLLIDTLDRMAAGNIEPIPQDESRATYAPPLKKADGRIDWHRSAAAIERLIRGTTPWPGAHTFNADQRLKIFRAAVIDATADAPPGTVVRGFADELRVATGNGVLALLELQGASGKRLAVADYLRGHPIPPGTVLR